MYEYIKVIRDFINNPRKQYLFLKANRALWLQLCSCMDVIEDSELAIAAYSEGNFRESDGDKLLVIYGLLQALFLQQDAVINLCESLNIHETIDKYPKLKVIRDIRTGSVGHPTKKRWKGQYSYNFISRFSLAYEGFELYSNYSNGQLETKNVSIPKLIADQRKYISEILNSVINKLNEEKMNDKKEFRMEKLVSIFPSTLDYYFEKVFETIITNKPSSHGEVNLQNIDKTLNSFREALKKRGIELETYESINYVFQLIDYPLSELKNYFHNSNSGMETNINEKTAYIFAFFMEKKISELRQMAQEIDEEYSK